MTAPGYVPSSAQLARFRGQCSSCQAPVLWAVTTAPGERPMPVNIKPDAERGNVFLNISGRELFATVLKRGKASGMRERGIPLHTSHFRECPHAAMHRKTRR